MADQGAGKITGTVFGIGAIVEGEGEVAAMQRLSQILLEVAVMQHLSQILLGVAAMHRLSQILLAEVAQH
jgi:hypothetical protein